MSSSTNLIWEEKIEKKVNFYIGELKLPWVLYKSIIIYDQSSIMIDHEPSRKLYEIEMMKSEIL